MEFDENGRIIVPKGLTKKKEFEKEKSVSVTIRGEGDEKKMKDWG